MAFRYILYSWCHSLAPQLSSSLGILLYRMSWPPTHSLWCPVLPAYVVISSPCSFHTPPPSNLPLLPLHLSCWHGILLRTLSTWSGYWLADCCLHLALSPCQSHFCPRSLSLSLCRQVGRRWASWVWWIWLAVREQPRPEPGETGSKRAATLTSRQPGMWRQHTVQYTVQLQCVVQMSWVLLIYTVDDETFLCVCVSGPWPH